jgi:hypothetical protein
MQVFVGITQLWDETGENDVKVRVGRVEQLLADFSQVEGQPGVNP